MVSVVQIPTTTTLRRIHQVQAITIVWMVVEACVSLSAAWIAGSPALLCLRWGQRNRTPLGWGRAMALSGAIPARAGRATSSPNRWSAALCGCGMRSSNLSSLAAGISRASAYVLGPSNSGGCSRDHAVARSTETPVVCDDEQRRTQGRRCRIRVVRLSLLDRPGGHWIERGLADRMG